MADVDYTDHADPNRIGHTYWTVSWGNATPYKTISKIAALNAAGGDLSKIQFHCMDDTWARVDSTVEPTLSWEDLLKIRCWQLRDKFSYLALSYSGGWDSTTALMAFVKNKIPLDEIIIYDRRGYMQDAEMDGAISTAQKVIKDYNLTTKLTVVDLEWDYHAKVYESYGENYIYLPGCQLCFNQTTRIVKHSHMPIWEKIRNQHPDSKVGFIEAHDKPRVNLYNNKWYHFYIDSGMYTMIGKGGVEMFYHTPDLPELQLKQIYMSIRYFENLINTTPGLTGDIVHKIQSFVCADYYAEWNRHIGRVCSPNQSAIHGLAKMDNFFSPNKDELARLTGHTKEYMEKIYKIWQNGLHKIQEMSGIDATTNGIPALLSKQHYVRDFIGKP
jgi:hypothetical protein